MSKPKHTPGPWKIEYDNDGNGGFQEWLNIGPAKVMGGRHLTEEDHANAQLIAAAPDLLEACQAMIRARDLWVPHEGEILESDEAEALSLLEAKILVAIAKATKEATK